MLLLQKGVKTMLVRPAEPDDLEAWRDVAREVALLFDSPTMADDRDFLDFAQRKIRQSEALVAVEGEERFCVGFLGFSHQNNRISWLAVRQGWRGHGAGGLLLDAALRSLDRTRPVTVITFYADHPGGGPARQLYLSRGFVEEQGEMTDELGKGRCRMVLPPTSEV